MKLFYFRFGRNSAVLSRAGRIAIIHRYVDYYYANTIILIYTKV